MKKTVILFVSVVLLFGCRSKPNFEIADFNALTNFQFENDTLILPLDLSNAIIQGITIPAKSQCNEGCFIVNFNLCNKSNHPKTFYYKIFYQNESYKHCEFIDGNYNPLSGNNFYGSWENPADMLHKTQPIPADNQFHTIIDSFRITGNPRNEKKYYGSKSQMVNVTDELISKTISGIMNTPEWFESVKEKARKNNVELEDQLYRDAIWVLKDNSQKGDENNRWKRNPRVGNYSFLLFVIPEEKIHVVPETLKDISKQKIEVFINPYYTLLHEKRFLKQVMNELKVIKSEKVLKTYAQLNLSAGIYIDLLKYKKPGVDTSYFNRNCGNSEELYSKAHFEQLFHHIDQTFRLKNIPLVYDVVGDNYSQKDYNENKLKYQDDELINDFVKTTDCPCKTVMSDTISNILTIKNPGNDSHSFRKENVGVNSRIGLTYGKFIAKIKFPAITNKDYVSNGLTCAFWLLYQEDDGWNTRSVCAEMGYIPKPEVGKTDLRVKTTSYSEIDFEILKCSQHWPEYCYKGFKNAPKDNPESNNDIIVTCTNWDLACRTPDNFSTDAAIFKHDKMEYVIHRWDEWYKALTIKSPVNHDSIFNQPFYYEIAWEPESITWRIGKTKENMRIVGYMDKTITTIPDNQMIIIFSQEFHYAAWWPLSPFIQDYIPFPKNDIQGQILEVQIE